LTRHGQSRCGCDRCFESEAGFDVGRRQAAEHARAALRSHVLSAAEAGELELALAGPIARGV